MSDKISTLELTAAMIAFASALDKHEAVIKLDSADYLTGTQKIQYAQLMIGATKLADGCKLLGEAIEYYRAAGVVE